MTSFLRTVALATLGVLFVTLFASAKETNSVWSLGRFQFDHAISRPVLENYLSRSITMQNLLTGQGNVQDNIRMIKSIGAKFIGRALCLWNAEDNFSNDVQRAQEIAPQVLAAVPDVILEACVFETVSPKVNQIAIPARVFRAFGLPVQKRHFRYDDMIYPVGQRRPMGPNAQVPDESRLETQLWFYYQAITYIDLGCEAIHFGQVEIMNKNDPDNTHWSHLLGLVRSYAATHARRHMVLCDGHTPTGGLMHGGNPLLDFNEFPLRIKAVTNQPYKGILQVGYADSLYNRSKGGVTPSGWSCEHLPYLVEFDNFGNHNPGKLSAPPFIWGWDEITWFALMPEAERNQWLRYAWVWVKKTDPNGHLEMPGSRVLSPGRAGGPRWFWANTRSAACPKGFNTEKTIKEIWESDQLPNSK